MNYKQDLLEEFLSENLNISRIESKRKKDVLFHVQKQVNLKEITKIIFPLYTLGVNTFCLSFETAPQQLKQFKKLPIKIQMSEEEFQISYDKYESLMKIYHYQLRELITNEKMKKFFDNIDFLLFYHINDKYEVSLFQFNIDNESFIFGLQNIRLLFKDFRFGMFQKKIFNVTQIENLSYDKSELLQFKISFFLFLNFFNDFLELYIKAVHFLNNQQ